MISNIQYVISQFPLGGGAYGGGGHVLSYWAEPFPLHQCLVVTEIRKTAFLRKKTSAHANRNLTVKSLFELNIRTS